MTELLTVAQVAEMLQTSRATVYAMCEQVKIRHVRIGQGRGSIRIPEDAVEEFLKRSTATPKAEIRAPRRPALLEPGPLKFRPLG